MAKYKVVRDNIEPALECATKAEAVTLARQQCEDGCNWAAVYADDASEPIVRYKRNPNSTGVRVYKATL